MMKVHGRCSSVFMVSMKHASYVDRIHGLGDDAESSSVTCIVGRRPSAARSRPSVVTRVASRSRGEMI